MIFMEKIPGWKKVSESKNPNNKFIHYITKNNSVISINYKGVFSTYAYFPKSKEYGEFFKKKYTHFSSAKQAAIKYMKAHPRG